MPIFTATTLAAGFAASMALATAYLFETLPFSNDGFTMPTISMAHSITTTIGATVPAAEVHIQFTPSHLDSLVEKLAQCESKGDPKAVNENDSGSPSYGLFQYKESTWKTYLKKYDLRSNASDSDLKKLIFDQHLQIKLTKLILAEKNGWKNWYNCVQKLDIAKEITAMYNHIDGKILSRL